MRRWCCRINFQGRRRRKKESHLSSPSPVRSSPSRLHTCLPFPWRSFVLFYERICQLHSNRIRCVSVKLVNFFEAREINIRMSSHEFDWIDKRFVCARCDIGAAECRGKKKKKFETRAVEKKRRPSSNGRQTGASLSDGTLATRWWPKEKKNKKVGKTKNKKKLCLEKQT